jgi:hypothetical protein
MAKQAEQVVMLTIERNSLKVRGKKCQNIMGAFGS